MLAAAVVVAGIVWTPAAAQADFGIAPASLTTTALNEDGTFETQAGSHPFAYRVHFDLNTDPESGQSEGGAMRDILFEAPPGLIGNPRAIPTCPRQDFEGGLPACKASTQVGVLRAIVPGIGEVSGPLYNLVPPPGTPVQFGFNSPAGLFSLQSASLRTEEGYGVTISAPDLPLEVTSVTATLWGTPADPGHTLERGPHANDGIASDAPLRPFLTLPTSCEASPRFTVRADSKLAPGAFAEASVGMLDDGGLEVPLSGCDAVPFSPAVLAGPSTAQAGSASGLGFELALPNQGLLNPKATSSETEPLKTEVTLPEGMIVNPAAANGLGACTQAQFKAASLTDPGCPEAARVGTLLVHTPLLEEALEGSFYLATPNANQFNSLLALYIVAKAPVQGIVIKQAGEVKIDQATGQLTAIFDGLPPIPYSSFEVRLREGARAALITPQTCGPYTTTARLYSFTNPAEAVIRTAPFTISSGAGGGPCAASEAQLPFAPTLRSGAANPLAGSYSPFTFALSRSDSDQRLDSLTATLPPGLTGKLAGLAQCPDAQIAAAAARSGEGEGALEAAQPSCPAASQIGVVNVGAGAGPQPLYVQGRAYLAGPYKGAPLSMAIITPAIAGPFDLGVVALRTALYVDESTARITVKSDPLPRILHGLPLDLRSAAVQIDREGFTLNPTNCEAMAVTAQVSSVTGALAAPQNRFRAGGCAALPFDPKLQINFKGSSHRRAHPKLIATLTAKPGEANTSFAQVQLPKAAFLDNAHIGTVCTRVQFAAQQCPAGSIYGKAQATTPLLDYTLNGTVYLRSSEHKLPDLVVAFEGPAYQPIKFVLAGKTDSVKGALRNTFEYAPDVPVSKFRLELFGGKRGLVILSGGLCANRKAKVRLKAHSGREYKATPAVHASCGAAKTKSR